MTRTPDVAAPQGGWQLAVIDDEPIVAGLAAKVLSPIGQVTVYADGRSAIQGLAAQRADLIVLDVMLPDVSGFEVCARIKSMPGYADVPILFVTGERDHGAEARALDVGGADFISKPFGVPALRARVRTHLELLRKTRDLAAMNARLSEDVVASQAQVQMLFAAIEQSPTLVTVADAEGRIEYVNAAFEQATGFSLGEVAGLPLSFNHLHDAAASSDEDTALACAIEASCAWSGPVSMRARDGSTRLLETCLSPVIGSHGAVSNFLSVQKDLSEQDHMAEQIRNLRANMETLVAQRTEALAAAKEHAEQASVAKSRFLANMSHEIRTPMNAILGFTHILMQGGLEAQHQDKLRSIQSASQHLLGLVNDILDLSKIEAGKMQLAVAPFSMDQVVRSTQRIVEPGARRKGLALRYTCQGPTPMLMGDKLRVHQALLNYLGNAVKFTDAGHIDIDVSARPIADGRLELTVSVSDTGPGFPADKAESLFSDFQQVDEHVSRQFGGTGLGLAITRRLIGMMGGQTGAQLRPEGGSRFWFTVPLAIAEATPGEHDTDTLPALSELADALKRHASARILVAEDSAMNRAVMELLLSDVGLKADFVENGAQAVERVRAHAYDLILMDVQMPIMDGTTATRHIRRLPGREALRVIALTANAFDEDRRACLDAGMDEHIGKPIDPRRLYARMLHFLDGARPAPDTDAASLASPVMPSSPARPPAPADVADVDEHAGVTNLGGDLRRYLTLSHKFVNLHRDTVGSIGAAIDTDDAGTAQRLSHLLRGAAGTLGARGVVEAAQAIEREIKAGAAASALRPAAQQLAARFAEFERWLNARQASEDASATCS